MAAAGARVAVLSAVLGLLAGGCGQNSGGASGAPKAHCVDVICTVTYPAVFRNNQGSTGGPGIAVFGVDTKLEEIGQGQALMRIGGQAVTLQEGASQQAAGLTVTAVSLARDNAIINYTKGGPAGPVATPTPTPTPPPTTPKGTHRPTAKPRV
jgi:hypothetical protein